REQNSIGTRPAGYGYETLHASMAVSVNSLFQDERTTYLRLAVVLEDMALAPSVLPALWGVGEREADDVAQLFVERSLASKRPWHPCDDGVNENPQVCPIRARRCLWIGEPCFCFLRSTFHSRTELMAENLFLRKQLALYQEHQIKSRRLADATRLSPIFWSRFLTGSRPCSCSNRHLDRRPP